MSDLKREALRHAMPWLVLAALLIIWEICCIVFQVPEIILPKPTKIFTVFFQRFDILMAYCWDTLWTTTVGFLLAIAFGLVLGLAIGASPFVYSGLYNIGADDHHTKPVFAVLQTLRNRSIHLRSNDLSVPNLEDPQLILKGAGQYAAMCTGCHLSPGVNDSELRVGMYPQPPNLS